MMRASTTKSHHACHHAHPSWFTHHRSIQSSDDVVRAGRFFLSRFFPLCIVQRRQIITRIERIRLEITREIMSRNFWSLLCNIRHAYVNELMIKKERVFFFRGARANDYQKMRNQILVCRIFFHFALVPWIKKA